MPDEELIKEFIRVEKAESEIKILVCMIEWESPSEPISKWVVATVLAAETSESGVEDTTIAILDDSRFFRICTECGERNPIGWMHDEQICQSCAEENHGVVY